MTKRKFVRLTGCLEIWWQHSSEHDGPVGKYVHWWDLSAWKSRQDHSVGVASWDQPDYRGSGNTKAEAYQEAVRYA